MAYAYAILDDWPLAQDAAQDAFIAAYYALPGLRDPEAFTGWFRRIVHHKALRHLRQPRICRWSSSRNRFRSAGTGGVDRSTRNGLSLDTVIQELPEAQRSVIILYYIAEHSQAEIAAFLDIPLGTVRHVSTTPGSYLKRGY